MPPNAGIANGLTTPIQGTGGRYISLPCVPVLTSRRNTNVSGAGWLVEIKFGWSKGRWMAYKFYETFNFNSLVFVAFIWFPTFWMCRIWRRFDFSPACQAHSDKFPHACHLEQCKIIFTCWPACSSCGSQLPGTAWRARSWTAMAKSKSATCSAMDYRYKSSNRALRQQRLQLSTIRTNNPESQWCWRLSP